MLKGAIYGLLLGLAFIGWEQLQAANPYIGQAVTMLLAAIAVAIIIKTAKEISE
jgi:hypothetical protein